ncbi:LuxR C-terminal-related transcriptional regulator [Serratia fonticola]|uniref:LuxR C-terminal-related transcriptional regulator n=1 Tax=Serratia fonticola TaxID=47917 RepID=A0AAJ2DEV7_SERFO|nr:LuxR C-terminal-related transcriptional regulator [Serratia fonticola]MDQ9129895.1 LuxR C-terminal-related transcriptional regulator [Serratia fonticola]
MIHIISDDDYFALGAESLLTQAGYQVNILGAQLLLNFDQLGYSPQDDAILLSSDNRILTRNTLLHAMAADMRVIQTVDGNISSDKWADGILPKKTARHELPRIIRYILQRKVKDWLLDLTLREMEIMDQLLKGKSNHIISKEMRISEKTVSNHKMKVLKKLGLTGLNSRAILIYGSYHNFLQQRKYH